jgi:hypothetical protein
MAQTKNSISSLLEQFLRLEKNALDVLSNVSLATTTSSDTVAINITNDTGAVTPMLIPSFGFLKSEIARLDNTVQQLAGLGDANAVIKLPDGTTKKIFAAAILRDPPAISQLAVPSDFKIKNNWFFESFLNPLLIISFDVTGLVPDTMRRAVVKRIIVQPQTDVDRAYFDTTYKGKNDIVYENLLVQLDANSLAFFVDEEIVDLPVSVMRYTGNFDIVKVSDEQTTVTSNGQTITTTKRKYKLNTLQYSDILAGTANTKTLKTNDVLITADGTKYNVDSVDVSVNTVILKRTQGSQPISMGANVLTIYSPPYTSKEIQVNVGFDERQVIFIKPIDPDFNVAASQFSPGVGFYSNEMNIVTPTGTTTLETFYKDQVVDFGQQFISAAKEKHIPSALGEIPSVPQLSIGNFQVVQINAHKADTSTANDIKQKLADKVSIENQINQIDQAITNKKAEINNSTTKSDAEKKQLKSDLDSLAREKSSQVNLYSSVVKDLNTKIKENPALLADAIFHVRGFWPIPAPTTSTTTNPQEVIQFRRSYRYIKADGNAPDTKQMSFVDNDGNTKTGFFSNWFEDKSDIRKRTFNESTGFYEWAIEDVTNPDAVNINQLDIPITKDEQVQIRVKSISEAGWPINPLESDWSPILTIPFPADLQIANEAGQLLTDAAAEGVKVQFQEELNARGLDLHLLSAFTQGDRYFGHVASDITSGFFTPEGNVIDLGTQLKNIDQELQKLNQLITQVKGFLTVFLVDQSGNVTNITPNSTTTIFAGFYKNLIQSGSGTSITYNHGQIFTTTYLLRLENGAATALELASYLPGGLAVIADSSPTSTNNDYKNNRQYDVVPMILTGVSMPLSGSIKQESPFQSAQSQGLWMYAREKSVGLDADLYALTVAAPNTTVGQGVPTVLSPTVPLNGCYLFPTTPTGTGLTDPNVWNGGAGATGGGTLTEFCIHTSHPDIGVSAFTSTLLTPQIATSGPNALVMTYPKFMHSDFFWKDITATDGKKQLEYIQPLTFTTGTTTPQHYPAKLGFYNNDSFLVGKYTCGAYLHLAPVDYTDIAVDGSTVLAKKLLQFGEQNAVNIPLVFQFRCSDKLGYVGGFRSSGTITNITYTKKVGIDIQVRDQSLFSFDIEVSVKYEQDSLVQPVFVPNVALDRLNVIRNQVQNAPSI